MTFEEYLAGKKINSEAFKAAEPARWKDWHELFAAVSEKSFTAQKLYLINPTRRKFLLKTEATVPEQPSAPRTAKPVIKPKIQ